MGCGKPLNVKAIIEISYSHMQVEYNRFKTRGFYKTVLQMNHEFYYDEVLDQ